MSDVLQPVEIEHERHHPFEKRATRGCGVCGRAKTHPDHHGCPPSIRELGSGNQFVYRQVKQVWQALFIQLLEGAELSRPLGRVLVEGEITFPDRRRRDQGNHRFFIEKALGDALTEGGWLSDDDWSRYEFGGLAARYDKGVARMRLMIFPTAAIEELAA